MAWNLPALPTAGVTIATVANWATKVIDSLRFLKGLDGATTLSDALILGAKSLTVNSIEIVGADGEVNKAAVEDHTHADAANCGTVAHSALTGLTAGDDHTQYQKENLLTTAGDIPYATAASTWARLGIGTANQVLKTNALATAPEWAAGTTTDHTHQSAGAQGGTLDHGLALTGLADNDHPQYAFASLITAINTVWAAGGIGGGGTQTKLTQVNGKGGGHYAHTGNGATTNTTKIYIDGTLVHTLAGDAAKAVGIVFFVSLKIDWYSPAGEGNNSGGAIIGNYGS